MNYIPNNKAIFFCVIFLTGLFNISFNRVNSSHAYISPLAGFSDEWNNTKYASCNTAASIDYMKDEEKDIVHIINLARINPSLFNSTVISKYVQADDKKYLLNNPYLKSLQFTMKSIKPLGILQPNKKCYSSASCHAETSGLSGYTGHDRNSSCKQQSYFFGECCEYGHNNALDIVMTLLIDENVTSLGHRKIILDPTFKSVAASIQPHKTYRFNTVIDFAF